MVSGFCCFPEALNVPGAAGKARPLRFSYLVSSKMSQNISGTNGFRTFSFSEARIMPGAAGKVINLDFAYFVSHGSVAKDCGFKGFRSSGFFALCHHL